MENKERKRIGLLDRFSLTESADSILNGLMVHYSTECMKEEDKPDCDPEKIRLFEEKFEEVRAINREPDNFKSLERMREIIDTYGPVLKKITLSKE